MVYACAPDEVPAQAFEKDAHTHRAVVCKIVPSSYAIMPPHDIRREISILKKIEHPNVSFMSASLYIPLIAVQSRSYRCFTMKEQNQTSRPISDSTFP